MTSRTYSSLALLTLLSACGTDPGVTSPDAAATTDADTVVLDDAGFGPMQVWIGYAELVTFERSGSDTITLSFASDAAGKVNGSIVFGTFPPPPIATDPSVGYPPVGYAIGTDPYLVEGFGYSIVGGTFQGGRLRFNIEPNELFKDWCALQAHQPGENPYCLPPVIQTVVQATHPMETQTVCYTLAGTAATGESIYNGYDCGAYRLCTGNSVCTCSPSGCDFRRFDIPVPTFDILFTQDSASGSTNQNLGAGSGYVTLRFTKADR